MDWSIFFEQRMMRPDFRDPFVMERARPKLEKLEIKL